MNSTFQKRHTMDFVFVLLLFCVFAMSALAIVYIGSQVYTSTVSTMEHQFNQNVAMDYVIEKLRQNHDNQAIEILKKDQVDVLCLHQTYQGQAYTTYIYVHDQQLKELLLCDGDDFELQRGEPLMYAENLSLSIEDHLLEIELTIHQQTRYAYFSLLGGALS